LVCFLQSFYMLILYCTYIYVYYFMYILYIYMCLSTYLYLYIYIMSRFSWEEQRKAYLLHLSGSRGHLMIFLILKNFTEHLFWTTTLSICLSVSLSILGIWTQGLAWQTWRLEPRPWACISLL
jgi:hypothetical protein